MGTRRFVTPESGEDLQAIAARVLPDSDDGFAQLQSWNLHLATRKSVGILPSDIVFVEPPPAAEETAEDGAQPE